MSISSSPLRSAYANHTIVNLETERALAMSLSTRSKKRRAFSTPRTALTSARVVILVLSVLTSPLRDLLVRAASAVVAAAEVGLVAVVAVAVEVVEVVPAVASVDVVAVAVVAVEALALPLGVVCKSLRERRSLFKVT